MVDRGKTKPDQISQSWTARTFQYFPQLKVALLMVGLLGVCLIGTYSTFRISAFEENKRIKRQFRGQQPLGGYCSSQNRVPFINPNNEIAQGCPGNRGCPNGYSCEISSTNQYLCCGLVGRPVNGFTVYRDANGRALGCGRASSRCPGVARCMQTQGGPPQQFVCAVPGGGGVVVSSRTCPIGYQPRFLNGQPQTCAINLAGSCTTPFACVQNTNGRFFCCRPSGDNNLCPGNQRTLSVGGQTQYCSQLGSRCPVNGYTCQNAMAGGQRICCGQGELVSQLRCANGRQPFLLGINPYYCTPAAGNCPDNYNCELSSTGQYVCCAGQAGLKCRDGSAPDVVGGQPSVCTVNGPETCNIGFACQQTMQATQTACCREPTCAGGGVFYKDATCSRDNPNSCGNGNTCEETSPNVYDCCSPGLEPGNCPNNGVYDSTLCTTVNSNECPNGYNCVATSNNVPGCCADAAATCPAQQEIEVGNEAPCIDDNDCGADYTCTASGAADSDIKACCRSAGGDPNTCANNQLPDLQNGNPRSCNPANPSCRQGYLCLKAADGATDICCRGPRCPGGVTVGQGPDGSPLECTTGGGECPSGQSCKTSTNMPDTQICCPDARRFLARNGRFFQ